MKNLIVLVALFAMLMTSCQQKKQSPYEQSFTNGALRIDYFHTGNATEETVKIDQTYEYQDWAGSHKNLIDSLNYGTYYYKIYEASTGNLIYSKGFDSYFKEYQMSTPAIEGQKKQFHESAIIPFPKADITFAL